MLARLLIAAFALLASAALPGLCMAADFVHTDGTAYVVPSGVKALSNERLAANQASFFIERPGVERAGVCVVSITVLNASANRETWARMKATQKADPAAAASKTIKAPDKLVRIEGVRDLTLTHGGNGVVYWLTLQRADGRQQMAVNNIALIGSRQIYAANCLSEPGLAFTPIELDRISTLVVSVKAQPPPPLPAAP
jgi:hypothetical protein